MDVVAGVWRQAAAALQQMDSLVATEERAQQRAEQLLTELMEKLQDQRRQGDVLREMVAGAVAGDLDLAAARAVTQHPAAAPVPTSLPAALRPAFVWITTFLIQLRHPACLSAVLQRREDEGQDGLLCGTLVDGVLSLFEHNLPADQARLTELVVKICCGQLRRWLQDSAAPSVDSPAYITPASMSGQLLTALLHRMPESRHFLDSVLSPVLECAVDVVRTTTAHIVSAAPGSRPSLRDASRSIADALCDRAAEAPIPVRLLATAFGSALIEGGLSRREADAAIGHILFQCWIGPAVSNPLPCGIFVLPSQADTLPAISHLLEEAVRPGSTTSDTEASARLAQFVRKITNTPIAPGEGGTSLAALPSTGLASPSTGLAEAAPGEASIWERTTGAVLELGGASGASSGGDALWMQDTPWADELPHSIILRAGQLAALLAAVERSDLEASSSRMWRWALRRALRQRKGVRRWCAWRVPSHPVPCHATTTANALAVAAQQLQGVHHTPTSFPQGDYDSPDGSCRHN